MTRALAFVVLFAEVVLAQTPANTSQAPSEICDAKPSVQASSRRILVA